MIEVQDLTFAYPGAEPILTEWSASFPAGSTTAVVGRSGQGKSTLLYLLGLMLRPQSGRILVQGVDATVASDGERSDLRAQVYGFVFQDAALDATRSVLDNVLEVSLYQGIRREESRQRAQSLLEQFGVALRSSARPGQISGGQAQRIALCRALLGRPAVILADEPTGNLDPETASVVLDAMQEHASGGGTVVIVTHDREVARGCDRRLVL